MNESELAERIVGVLAEIRAESVQELEAQGRDAVMVTSIEVVAILVELEPATGIDPTDADVMKGCNLQSLLDLVRFVAAVREAIA